MIQNSLLIPILKSIYHGEMSAVINATEEQQNGKLGKAEKRTKPLDQLKLQPTATNYGIHYVIGQLKSQWSTYANAVVVYWSQGNYAG